MTNPETLIKKREKSQATIKIDTTLIAIADSEDLMALIFYKSKDDQKVGAKFYDRIVMEGGIIDKQLDKLALEFEANQSQMYRVIARLKHLALIKKEYGEYVLSGIFALRLFTIKEFHLSKLSKFNKIRKIVKKEDSYKPTKEEQIDIVNQERLIEESKIREEDIIKD